MDVITLSIKNRMIYPLHLQVSLDGRYRSLAPLETVQLTVDPQMLPLLNLNPDIRYVILEPSPVVTPQ
jgi:hypothetical protein